MESGIRDILRLVALGCKVKESKLIKMNRWEYPHMVQEDEIEPGGESGGAWKNG